MLRLHVRSLAAVAALALTLASAAPALAAPPANDDIGSPIVIAGIPYSNSQDTSEATTGPTDPDCFGTGPTVWYSFTAPANASLLATTFGSDYDTTLYLGTPDGAGGIKLIDCNDDAFGLQSAIRFEADAGTTYLFMVGAYASGPGGNLVFNLDVAPPPIDLSLTVDPVGSVDRYGGATISGRAVCSSPAEFGWVELQLTQRVGRFYIRGFGGAELTGCGPDGVPWQVQISSESGSFGGGQASVAAFAEACNAIECSSAFTETGVRLRK